MYVFLTAVTYRACRFVVRRGESGLRAPRADLDRYIVGGFECELAVVAELLALRPAAASVASVQR